MNLHALFRSGEVLALPYRHLPFGIPEQALTAELRRRRAEHRRRTVPLRDELTRLKKTASELSQYLSMLRAEIVVLEEEERMLLRELADPASPPRTAPREPDPLEPQRRTLRHYRTLQTQLSASVLSLIAPFLASDPPRSPGPDPKEERPWPSTQTPSGSGFGEP